MEISDNKHVCSVVSGNKIFFVSVKPLSLISNVETSYSAIRSFSWSCDNKYYCYSGNENYLSISCTNIFKLVKPFAKDIEQNFVHFSRTKPECFMSGGTGSVTMLWHVKGADIIPFKGFTNVLIRETVSAAFNQDDSLLVVGGRGAHDQLLCLYDVNGGQTPLKSYSLEKMDIPVAIEFAPHNKNQFGVVTNHGAFYLMDVTFNDPIITLKNDISSPAKGLFFSPNNRNEVFISYADKCINVYDMLHRKTADSITTPYEVLSCEFLSDGNGFLVGTHRGKIYQYDFRSKQHPLDCLDVGDCDITALSLQSGPLVIPDCSEIDHVSMTSLTGNQENIQIGKIKRRRVDSTSTPSFKGNITTNFKNIKNMFASPAVKRIKSTRSATVDAESLCQSMYDFDIKTHSPNVELAQRASLDTSNMNRKSLRSDIIEFDKGNDQKSDITELDKENDQKSDVSEILLEHTYIFSDLKYMIHSEIRDLQIQLVRQHYTQTNELKNHIQTVLEDSHSREQELMQENIRLRDEIIRLQNITNELQKQLKQFKI